MCICRRAVGMRWDKGGARKLGNTFGLRKAEESVLDDSERDSLNMGKSKSRCISKQCRPSSEE